MAKEAGELPGTLGGAKGGSAPPPPPAAAYDASTGPAPSRRSDMTESGGRPTGSAGGDRTAPRVAGRTAAPAGLRPRAGRGRGRVPGGRRDRVRRRGRQRGPDHARRGLHPDPDRRGARWPGLRAPGPLRSACVTALVLADPRCCGSSPSSAAATRAAARSVAVYLLTLRDVPAALPDGLDQGPGDLPRRRAHRVRELGGVRGRRAARAAWSRSRARSRARPAPPTSASPTDRRSRPTTTPPTRPRPSRSSSAWCSSPSAPRSTASATRARRRRSSRSARSRRSWARSCSAATTACSSAGCSRSAPARSSGWSQDAATGGGPRPGSACSRSSAGAWRCSSTSRRAAPPASVGSPSASRSCSASLALLAGAGARRARRRLRAGAPADGPTRRRLRAGHAPRRRRRLSRPATSRPHARELPNPGSATAYLHRFVASDRIGRQILRIATGQPNRSADSAEMPPNRRSILQRPRRIGDRFGPTWNQRQGGIVPGPSGCHTPAPDCDTPSPIVHDPGSVPCLSPPPRRLLPFRDRGALLERQRDLTADAGQRSIDEQQRLAAEFAAAPPRAPDDPRPRSGPRGRATRSATCGALASPDPRSDPTAGPKAHSRSVVGSCATPRSAVLVRARCTDDRCPRSTGRLHLGGYRDRRDTAWSSELGDALAYECQARAASRRVARGTYVLGELSPARRRASGCERPARAWRRSRP